MHRSAAEGRFGVAEPAGRASVCARTLTIGVFTNALPLNTPKSLELTIKLVVGDGGRIND